MSRAPSYYDLVLAGMGLAAPPSPHDMIRTGRRSAEIAPPNFATGAIPGYWPGHNSSPATVYNPNYYAKLLAAGQTTDPRTGRSTGLGMPQTPTPQTTLNPFTAPLDTGRVPAGANPAVDPGVFDVAQSAALSNDPRYQENLGRALFSLGGGTQDVSYAEQRRQSMVQNALLPQKRKDLAAVSASTQKSMTQLATFAANQPGLPVEALNEIRDQIANRHEAQSSIILASPSVGSLADIAAAEDSPEYNTAKLTEFVASEYGPQQGEIVKSLTTGGATPDILVKYLNTLATNQGSLQKESLKQQVDALKAAGENLDTRLEAGLVDEGDYYQRKIQMADRLGQILAGNATGQAPAATPAPQPIVNVESVTARRVSDAKSFAAANNKPFYASPADVDAAVAANKIEPGQQFVDGTGQLRMVPMATIPSAKKPTATKPATKAASKPAQESAFDKQAKLAKRTIPADVARQILDQLQSGR